LKREYVEEAINYASSGFLVEGYHVMAKENSNIVRESLVAQMMALANEDGNNNE